MILSVLIKNTCRVLTLCLLTIPACFTALAQSGDVKVINAVNYGIKPNTGDDYTERINKLIEDNSGTGGLQIKFEKGRYDFRYQNSAKLVYFESNTTDNNPKNCAIVIKNKQFVEIDGGGAAFVFHGRMQPFTIDSGSNITIKNLSVDFETPLTAQAKVKAADKNGITITIDKKQYPYTIAGQKLQFTGDGWKSNVHGIMEFDSGSANVEPQTGDLPALGDGWENYTATQLSHTGGVRLSGSFKRLPKVGNVLILRHSERDHAGIFIADSKNVKIENVQLFYAAGIGVLSQFSEDLSFLNFSAVPNTAKGRYFATHADGLHFSNCRGNIVVNNCHFKGLMDDGINVHGTNVKIIEVQGRRKLKCRFMEQQSQGMVWARQNETVGFIDNATMANIGLGKITSFKKLSKEEFEVELADDMPDSIRFGFVLENLSWVANVNITSSFFDGGRARGVLLTTPGKVVVEKNIFNSSGSAILIAGDANYWYESGGVRDVLIQNNEFRAGCLTSLYQFAQAIITIEPEIPRMDAATPRFHRNISIINNTFNPFDYPVLYAKSVSGLNFSDNKITRSYLFKPYHKNRDAVMLNGCTAVTISNNKLAGDVLGKTVSVTNMPKTELKLSGDYILRD